MVHRQIGKNTDKLKAFIAKVVINDANDDFLGIQYYNTYDKTKRMQNRRYIPVWWVKSDSTTTRPTKDKQRSTDPNKWEEFWGTQEEVQQLFSVVEPYVESFPKKEILARGFTLNDDGTLPRFVLKHLS